MREIQYTTVLKSGVACVALVAAALAASAAQAQQATRLDEISVEGQAARAAAARGNGRSGAVASAVSRDAAAGPGMGESPTGPVRGFVATRSRSATKTNTPLIETPQSITVIGREQIDTLKAETLSQATAYSAGIYSGAYGPDQRVDYFLLRGFLANDYGLYKDSLQLLNYAFGTFQTDPYGLERIEVLRGPSAVLFGAGNPGGIVNMVSKRPPLAPFGSVEVGGGSFGQRYAAFDIGGPADETGHLYYRLTGIGRQGGTQVEGADADRAYIAPAFTWRPDAGTSLTVLSSYQRDSTAVTANFLPYYGTVRPTVLGLRIPRSLNVGDPNINTFQRQQAMVGYEFEHAVNDVWTVRQNARYAFVDSFQNSYIGQLGYVVGDATQTQLRRYQFLASSKANLFQVDNQAEARFSDGLFQHDLILGIDYKNYALQNNQGTENFPPRYVVPPLNIVSPNYGPPNGRPLPYLVDVDRFQQLGFYVQDQIKLTERLSLIGGLRQDFADSVVDSKLFNTTSARHDEALTGRVALLYNFDPGVAPYVVYSTSFQPQIGPDALTGGTLKPDTGEQVEVGLKIEPVGQGYSFSIAGFDLVRNNPPIPILPPGFGTTQLGAVRSRGVEAQFVASLFDGLNVVASATHYDLEYIKSQQPALIGKTPTNVPETFASVFADYTIPFGDWRGFGFGGGVRYVGRSYADQLNILKVPEYVLFDATVHYQWDRWRAAITAANIGDRRFVSSCQAENSCFYGEARRIVASLAYKW